MNRIQRRHIILETSVEAHSARDFAEKELRAKKWEVQTHVTRNILELESDNEKHLQKCYDYVLRLGLRVIDKTHG